MPQMNPKTVESALVTLIGADSEREAIELSRTEDLKSIDSKHRNAQKLARQNYEAAGESVANNLEKREREARAAADQLAGQGVPGFEEECERRGISAGGFSDGSPRPMSELAKEINHLDRSWKHFDELNEVEGAMIAESKPLTTWAWLGVLGAGFVTLFVMSFIPV